MDPPEPFRGISFASNLKWETTESIRDMTICAQHLGGTTGSIEPKSTTPMLYAHQWAYAPVGSEGEPELYNIQDNPGATANLTSERPSVLEELKAKFLYWLMEMTGPSLFEGVP